MYIIILLIGIIIIVVLNNQYYETFDNNEAIQTLSSMYNNGALTATSINTTGASIINDLTINGTLKSKSGGFSMDSNGAVGAKSLNIASDINVAGNSSVGSNSNVAGTLTTNALTARIIQPNLGMNPVLTVGDGVSPVTISGNPITIGDNKSDIIMKHKFYSVTGNLPNGDLTNITLTTSEDSLKDALKICDSNPHCQHVTTDKNGRYWFKSTNNHTTITGSFAWPDDITFSGAVHNVPYTSGISGIQQCKDLAKSNKKTNWAWTGDATNICGYWNNNDTFDGSEYTTYFIKK